MKILDNNAIIRNNFKKLAESIKVEDLTKIPTGFNNNILWNFGHAIATQNVLIYQMSGLPFSLPDDFIATYRKGTYPPKTEDPKAELEVILLFSDQSLAHLRKDLTEYKFTEYEKYDTSFGVQLTSVNDAMAFNNIHESLHLGYSMALKRALGY
ncbi:DinB family protein [Marivirga sp. S37H4]|uniref:DinB family protein n=1 Tax=Marivirga aurantiaca TaxID=2802615 RepID=A0A934WWN2_9BACT|nr:DinB family protein [Marivirga aurantiaca]MBK6264200.1 DinB family protein [Marivirga aurantiaca]